MGTVVRKIALLRSITSEDSEQKPKSPKPENQLTLVKWPGKQVPSLLGLQLLPS